ncbi:hypothetical protein D3C87_1649780 [compost metagenome]
MAKMQNLSTVEVEIFSFLKQSFKLTPRKLKPQFENLLQKLKPLEKNNLENRAFMYLDVISWLESKIEGIPVQQVIREKYLISQT